MILAELDRSDEAIIAPRLLKCCGCNNWVQQMLKVRPFNTRAELEAKAAEIWFHLKPEDWLEAFSKHPKIGEKGKVSQWSAQEQSGMNSAAAQVAGRLAELNQVYFEKFGFIFIVCATGKNADEMLSLLEARLPNEPSDELRIAAAEQSKITILRLRKLLSE
jgi:2-oxo-4-hydroxy-4-carboxy-5-ureidoimidazoline decarboxylase